MRRSIQEELDLDSIRRLAAGKLTSTMLDVVFELDLFGKLQGKSVSFEELESMLGMPTSSARLVAQFLCREGLLVKHDGSFSNTPTVEKFLTNDNVNRRELQVLRKYSSAIDADKLKHRLFHPADQHGYQIIDKKVHYAGHDPRRVLWGEELAARYDFKQHKSLLDVAGAAGGWCIGIRKTNPHLDCVVFDLPDGQEFAEKNFAEANETEHIRFVGGSFLTDDLPQGADVALIANILHHWSIDECRLILSKIFAALAPGGTLLVHEFYFEDDWTGMMEPVFQAFIGGLISWQPAYGEMEQLVREVGFINPQRGHELVICKKPIS